MDGPGIPTASDEGGPVGVVPPARGGVPRPRRQRHVPLLGNAAETGEVGLLLIDLETLNRILLQSSAQDPDTARFPGAKLLLRVAVERVFLNCARHIHGHARVEASPYVPAPDGAQPRPSWKRIDFPQESPTAPAPRRRAAPSAWRAAPRG